MSADRYEITVDGPCVTIKEPCGFSGEYHRSEYADNVLYGALRQQARDLALLTQMLHDQRLVIDDLEHRRVNVCDENDQLRAELAAAVATTQFEQRNLAHCSEINGELRKELAAAVALIAARDETIAELELRLRISRQSNKELRESAEQAEARLAAIEAQPDVAICYHGKEQGWARLIGDTWPTGALIARPAKD